MTLWRAGAALIFWAVLYSVGEAATLTERKLLVSSQRGEHSGHSVGADANWAIVGSPDYNGANQSEGHAEIYSRNNGGTNNWGRVAFLQAPSPYLSDEFGASVDIDASRAIVGAPGVAFGRGAAYIFTRVAADGTTWSQGKLLTIPQNLVSNFGAAFGTSTAISGDLAIVGALQSLDSSGLASGGVFVFSRNAGGSNNWGQVAHLTIPTAGGWDGSIFGVDLALSGDTLVVGAGSADTFGPRRGAAFVYRMQGGNPATWSHVGTLASPALQEEEYFGSTVAIDGDNIIVGASRLNRGSDLTTGAAYVYERNLGGAEAWGLAASLAPTELAAGSAFGTDVSIAGNLAFVGAPYDHGNTSISGTTYAFRKSGAGWNKVARISAGDAEYISQYGSALAQNSDTLFVGAPYKDSPLPLPSRDDTGAVYAYYNTNTVPEPLSLSMVLLASVSVAAHSRKRMGPRRSS